MKTAAWPTALPYALPRFFHALQWAPIVCLVLSLAGCSGASNSSDAAAPKAPMANAGGPYTGIAGTPVSFSGAASTDPQGQTLTYAWNFGDGGTGTGVSPSHTYGAGAYTVSLTVTDTSGLMGTATSKATIAALLPPVANFGGPFTGSVGVPVNFNASSSTDPQGQALTYMWTFGDGGSATGVSPTHTFTANGSFNVILIVTDASGLAATATAIGTIAPVAPTANAGGPYAGTVGVAVSFVGGASSDPQGQALTYAWSFGDGGTGTGAAPTHTYAAPGTYTVSVKVTDTSGLSNTATSKATIAAAPPVANAGGPYTGTAGTAVSFSGAGSSDPQGQALTYAWNFGDGGTGTGVSPSHTYTAGGTYTVSLTVTNMSGLTGTATGKSMMAVAPLADAALTGIAYGGQQPIAGAHVYMFAANTTGYGQASVSLLSAANTGAADTVGAYVLTGANGGFSLTGDYTCMSGQQVYLYVLGGNSGSGINSAAGLLAAIGNCPSTGMAVTVNEVTTVAAAYAFAGFAVDATHVSSSGTALAQVGVANAFANAGNLANLATGVALATTPAGNGTVPQAKINTLANILAGCAGSSGTTSSGCTLLFGYAKGGTTSPVDTATASINIAHNPGANVAALFGIQASVPAFQTALSTAPNDWTIGLSFTAGGLNNSYGIAVDGSGDVWIVNILGNSVTELSPSGASLSGGSGYTAGGILNNPTSVAIDLLGDAWITNDVPGTVVELSPRGSAASDPNGYAAGLVPYGIAIDGSGNVWVANELSNSTSELSGSTGLSVGRSPFTGGGQNLPYGVAIDPSGNAWVVNYRGNNTTKISSSGTTSTYGPIGQNIEPDGVAIDAIGNVWIADAGINSLTKLSSNSVAGVNYTGGGLNGPGILAIDGSGNVWVPNSGASISEFSNAGVALSSSTGFQSGTLVAPAALAVDGSGNVWVSDNSANVVSEFVGSATPVVTPLAAGVKNNTLGTRP